MKLLKIPPSDSTKKNSESIIVKFPNDFYSINQQDANNFSEYFDFQSSAKTTIQSQMQTRIRKQTEISSRMAKIYSKQIAPVLSFEVLNKTSEGVNLGQSIMMQFSFNRYHVDIECEYLGIYETGKNKKEALENFWYFFDHDSKAYLETSDRGLTVDGLNLKNKYKTIF